MKNQLQKQDPDKARMTRAATVTVIRREADGAENPAEEVRVSVSSETPYYREYIWDADKGKCVEGYEVLGHGDGEIDFSRCADGLVIQDTHRGDQIGIIRAPSVEDGKLTGVIEFCCGDRAQEIRRDALAGIRRNMSVGYFVNRAVKTGQEINGVPVYRIVDWTPCEASFVNVPADTQVGVGRSVEETPAAKPAAENKETPSMEKPEEIKAETQAGVTADEVRGIIKGEFEALRAELSKKPEMPPKAARVTEFDEGEEREIGKRYNLLAAIRSLAGEKVDDAFEREVSAEIAKRTGKSARGLFMPECAFRTLTGKTNVANHITGNGAATVATELLASQYIDALVARTVLGEAGVTVLDGLVGDIAIPKGGTVTAGWTSAEDADAAVGTPAFTQVTGSPHTIAANVDITRKLLIQSSVGIQDIVTRLILDSIARGIEAAAFDGTGSSGQPTGLAATSGVGSVSMTAGAPTKAQLVEFWEKVYTANAAGASMKYIGSPAVRALLAKSYDLADIDDGASTPKKIGAVIAGDGYFLKDGKVEGYDYLTSGLCASKKLYFGDWAQLVLAFWSGVDLTVDPYSLSTKGAIRLVAFQDCDVLVRHPQAFAVGTAIA